MPPSKPDSLFYKTLLTEAWTSNIALTGLIGLLLTIFFCGMFGVYENGGYTLGTFGILLGFSASTLMVMTRNWPALRVYNTGQEYEPEKIRNALGARPLSQREFAQLTPILDQVSEQIPKARGFRSIYIIDMSAIGTFTIGNTIYLTSLTLDSPHLAPLMTHELGHIQNEDGTIMLALRLLFTNFWNRSTLDDPLEFSTGTIVGRVEDYAHLGKWIKASSVMKDLKTGLLILGARNMFAGGGFGVRKHIKEWSAYFQAQDYKADDFVVKCGYGLGLIDYLEEYKLLYASNPLAWQPPPELRIDRILQKLYGPQSQPDPSQQLPRPIRIESIRSSEPQSTPTELIRRSLQLNENIEEQINVGDSIEISSDSLGESVEDALMNFRSALQISDNDPDESIEDALTNFKKLIDGDGSWK